MSDIRPGEPRPLHPAIAALEFVTLWLKRVLEAIVVVLVLSFFVVVLAAVWYRYVLNDSLVWTEEFVRFSLFWTVLLGAALVSYENGHLRIDAIHNYLPESVSHIFRIFAHLMSILFCCILFVTALQLFWRTTGTSPALRFPMRWVYAAMIFGSACIVVMTVRALLTDEPGEEEVL